MTILIYLVNFKICLYFSSCCRSGSKNLKIVSCTQLRICLKLFSLMNILSSKEAASPSLIIHHFSPSASLWLNLFALFFCWLNGSDVILSSFLFYLGSNSNSTFEIFYTSIDRSFGMIKLFFAFWVSHVQIRLFISHFSFERKFERWVIKYLTWKLRFMFCEPTPY